MSLSQSTSLHVTNGPVNVGSIRIIGIVGSSSVLIGDTGQLTLYSYFDTPPESYVEGPLAPLPLLPEADLP